MTGFVVDCSIAVSWLLEDEATPRTDALLDRLRNDGAHAPGVRSLELGNALAQAERRERISSARVAAYLDIVDRLPIVTDMETESRAFREILALARRLGLTTYDAAYPELAMRREAELATLDKALIRAARRVSVSVLP